MYRLCLVQLVTVAPAAATCCYLLLLLLLLLRLGMSHLHPHCVTYL
jgi:hypothetical protein